MAYVDAAGFDLDRRIAEHEAALERRGKMTRRRWKGKERETPTPTPRRRDVRHARRDEGDGGSDGVVLDLSLVGDGLFTV